MFVCVCARAINTALSFPCATGSDKSRGFGGKTSSAPLLAVVGFQWER